MILCLRVSRKARIKVSARVGSHLKAPLGKGSASNLTWLLAELISLLNTRESILVRNLTNVRNVRRHLDNIHTLLSIRKFIMEFNTRKLLCYRTNSFLREYFMLTTKHKFLYYCYCSHWGPQFLSGCWLKADLSSLPHGLLQHGCLLHQSVQAKKPVESADIIGVIILCNLITKVNFI